MEAGAEDGGERFASGNLGQSRRDLGQVPVRAQDGDRLDEADLVGLVRD